MTEPMHIVVLGLSITSSWGNGHATTYRSLMRELSRRGHDVLFLERDVPWYAGNRDMPNPPFGRTMLYESVAELRERHAADVRRADLVIVGSYVPEGIAVGEWVLATAQGVRAFYDIDTPVTLARIARHDCDYISRAQIARYDLYLSFTGGPTLEVLERTYAAPRARPLYCAVDPQLYFPEIDATPQWDLGYMGTYSADRQSPLDALMLDAARSWSDGRFVVAGPQYPEQIAWPANVERIQHLAPAHHRRFYCGQRFTLNITRAAMIDAGYSPSVRLFEAAACGIPVISDAWSGLGEFFSIGSEIVVTRSAADTLSCIREMPEDERVAMGERARARALREHTAQCRAQQLEDYARALMKIEVRR